MRRQNKKKSQEKSCGRKLKHQTREQALMARAHYIKKNGTQLKTLEIYKCSACKCWHLGKNIPTGYKPKNRGRKHK